MEENLQALLDLLEQNKAKDLALFDVRNESEDEDFVILCNLPTCQENKVMAEMLMQKFSLQDFPEGYNRGEWIIFLLDKVVLHLFIPGKREKYNLDKLYQNMKVNLKTKSKR